LDYFVINKEDFGAVKDSIINNDILGSDHCPIELELNVQKLSTKWSWIEWINHL